MTKQLDELLQTCEQEQLHLSGMIQSFGALIVLNKEDFIITHVSENIKDFINFEVNSLLGKNIQDFFPTWIDYFELLDNTKLKDSYIYQKIKSDNLYLKISKKENSIVIDIQITSNKIVTSNLEKNQHKLFITPDTLNSYLAYLEIFMNIVSKTICFDRVMLYQFQKDWSGKVVAERVTSESSGSYLNLMFPASDIPKIARDLYMINPSRIIADIDSKNVDIITLNDDIPDLTYSDTRSVSPLHIEYLKNMGVKASFSIPVIVSGNLWGLLACHQFEHKILDPVAKKIAIEQTKLFSLGIKNYLTKRKLNYTESIQYKINDIMDAIVFSLDIEEQLIRNQEKLLNLIQSDGFIMVINGSIITFGSIPTNDSFLLIDKLLLESEEIYLESNSIIRELFPKKQYLGPAGVLGFKNKFKSDESIRCYWFRNENIKELHWAGNPEKPVTENADVTKLSPRRSFENFIEIRRGFCDEFDKLEISTGIKLYNNFYKYINKVKYEKK